MKPEVLQKILSAVKVDNNLDPKAREAVKQLVQDMYLATVDEHHARTSHQRRLNRAGYDKDMLRSFLSHARAEANFLAQVAHGGKTNEALYRMQQQAMNTSNDKRRDFQDYFSILAEHYARNLQHKDTPIQDSITAFTSAFQLATSVGYHVTNMTQPWMTTLPKLAGEFNDYSGAVSQLLKGYKVLSTTGFWGRVDPSKISDKDKGLREMLQLVASHNMLDVGMNEDLTEFEHTRTGYDAVDKSTGVVKKAMHNLNKIARAVEVANRVAAATAAYNMAIAKGKSQEDAAQFALRTVQTTQGDFSRTGAPLLLKKLPKPMVQYRKFQLMMAALYVKAFREAGWGSKAEKEAARRFLTYKLMHTAFAAGALGLPMMNIAQLVAAGLFGDDDEPYDLERWARKNIGDDMMADLILRGPMAMAGLDMSAKLGEDKIFSIAPYSDFDVSSPKGLAKTAFDIVGGPAGAQAARFADGVGLLDKGELWKGVEKFMPKGVADASKAFRIANEGYTVRNGDVMIRPDDINAFALVLDSLGMPSAHVKRMDWLRGQQFEIGKFYTDRTHEIQLAYKKAVASGDSGDMAQARQEWMDLQAGKDRLRYLFNDSSDALKRQPLSDLLKYPQSTAKREQRLQRAAAIAE